MNVQSIHNATFAKRLPPTFLAQAYALANFHEYGVFSDTNFAGIGNSEINRIRAHNSLLTRALDSRSTDGATIAPHGLPAHSKCLGSALVALLRYLLQAV